MQRRYFSGRMLLECLTRISYCPLAQSLWPIIFRPVGQPNLWGIWIHSFYQSHIGWPYCLTKQLLIQLLVFQVGKQKKVWRAISELRPDYWLNEGYRMSMKNCLYDKALKETLKDCDCRPPFYVLGAVGHNMSTCHGTQLR